MRRVVWSVAVVLQPERILRGDVLSQIYDSAELEFRATEEDGNVSKREEETAEPLDARKARLRNDARPRTEQTAPRVAKERKCEHAR